MHNKLIERLTDNYSKDLESNVGKLFIIVGDELEELEELFSKIYDSRDIDKAEGRSLDRVGNNVQQLRWDTDDEFYRQLIKTKIIANLSIGDIETINEVANVLLGEGYKGVEETWNKSRYDFEPAGLEITITNLNRTIPFVAVERVTAAGVGLYWVLELKPDMDRVYIAAGLSIGEEITVYPWRVSGVESRGEVFIGTSFNQSVEDVTVYPKGVI